MQLVESAETLATIANATELATCLMQQVIGNELASTLQGSSITRETLNALVLAKFQQHLIPAGVL